MWGEERRVRSLRGGEVRGEGGVRHLGAWKHFIVLAHHDVGAGGPAQQEERRRRGEGGGGEEERRRGGEEERSTCAAQRSSPRPSRSRALPQSWGGANNLLKLKEIQMGSFNKSRSRNPTWG